MSIPGSGSPLLLATTAAAAADAGYVIPKSLRFNGGDSAYLNRTPSAAGSQTTWTWSCWLKRSNLGDDAFIGENGGYPNLAAFFQSDGKLRFTAADASSAVFLDLITTQVFKDVSAWYHIVCVLDTTNSTQADRARIYVNGARVTDLSTATYPSQNATTIFNASSNEMRIGQHSNVSYFDGLMADIQFVDGQALQATDFGETRSSDGVWVPKEYTGSYGVALNQTATWSNVTTLSGGSTASGKPLSQGFDGSLSTATEGDSNNEYAEIAISATIAAGGVRVYAAVTSSNQLAINLYNGSTEVESITQGSSGAQWYSTSSYAGAITKIRIERIGRPFEWNAVEVNGELLVDAGVTVAHNGFHLNFSDSSTNEALGYDSAPTVPALNPKKGFDIVTYSGNATARTIGGLAFEPGLVIVKARNSPYNHYWVDSVRGADENLYSNSTEATQTADRLSGFEPGGFGLTSHTGVNGSSTNFVAWCWAAGGAASANSDGTITSQVSANTDYGFSIVTYTGSAGGTVGHGLGAAPKIIIAKSRTQAKTWPVYTEATGKDKYLNFPGSDAAQTSSGVWGSSAPTSTVFGIENSSTGGNVHGDIVAYCWTEISGYSKISSYSGSGASGNKQTTGFKPRWVLIKGTDSAYNWQLFDSERNPANPRNGRLELNNTSQETTTGNNVNFLDDGFDFNTNSDKLNGSSKSYIYMAFADLPGNHWDVNNIVTNEGLTTSKTQFDVVTYTGNGGTQAIGQPVYSNETTGGNNTSNMFDGSGSSWNNLTAGNTITFTPSRAIACTQLDIWVDTGTPIRVNVNGGGYGSTFTQSGLGYVNITPGGGMTSLTSLLIDAPSGGGGSGAGIRGLRINGTTIVVDGDGGPGLKFQPDLIWLKGRSYSISHLLYDSVRGYGADKELVPNGTNAEGAAGADSTYGYVSAVDSSGFTIEGGSDADNGYTNKTNATYVAWCWKAGGTAVSNTDGSITSSVSANAAYGFSIVSYTGTGSNATVGHGLNAVPELLITKDRDNANSWHVQHSATGSTKALFLNSNGAAVANGAYWNNTTPTSSVFSVSTADGMNGSGSDYIAYCFANVSGYQRIGSYTGNGSSTGPVVVTGFKPRFLLIKGDNTSGWVMYDSERDPVNHNNFRLQANSSGAESTNDNNTNIDFLNNGFQLRNSDSDSNGSGVTYVYLAIGDDEIGSDEDCLVDVPNAVTADADATDTTGGYQRGNYATINSLDSHSDLALSNGNLEFDKTGTNGYGFYKSTIGLSSGKWYAEFTMGGEKQNVGITLASHPVNNSTYAESGTNSGVVYYSHNGYKYGHGSAAVYGETFADGDVIGIALDLDNSKVYFSKNGVFQNSGDPVGGANPAQSGLSGTYVFAGHSNNTSNTTMSGKWNFGQMRFKYPMPSGYAAVNTTALPAATIPDGSVYFDSKLWTGNGSNGRSITGYEFSPDLVWIKNRSNTGGYNHILVDSVRTAGRYLTSSANNPESVFGYVSALNSDGFTISNHTEVNGGSNTYVGWAWDAGSSTVSNSDGSVTTSVRANQTAGFSICTFTSPSSGNFTIGHGLNVVPEFVLVKTRGATSDWSVFHKDISTTTSKYLILNTTIATDTYNYVWGAALPTTSVVGLTSGGAVATSQTCVAYCFASVAGYSAIGSFETNGSADNVFVNTGFRPRFIIWKRHDGANSWGIFDTARGTTNVVGPQLLANSENAESTGAYVDILSNGFKLRNSGFGSGQNYIYYAVAENPFQANGGLAR